MFAFVAVAPPTPHPIVPVAMPPGPDADYEAVVNRIGAAHLLRAAPKANTEIFEQFLAENGIMVYDRAKVKRYLNRQYGRTRWGYRALRSRDNASGLGHFIASDGTIDNGSQKWRKRHNGVLLGGTQDVQLYSKPVPYPVLLTVERIGQKFPDATFWVSDEAKRQLNAVKDPFLLVRYGDKEYIIERWDEPGFLG